MSGIGDYIHYTRSGYIAHGTTKDGPPGSNAQQVFQRTKNDILSEIGRPNEAHFRSLEQKLSQFFFAREENLGDVNFQHLEELLGAMVLKWSNIAFSGGGVTQRKLSTKQPKYATIAKYYNSAKRIKEIMDARLQKSQQSNKDITNLEKQLDAIQKLIDELEVIVKDYETANQGKLESEKPKTIDGNKYDIALINTLLGKIDGHQVLSVIGTYLEGIIGLVDDRVQSTTEAIGLNLADQILTGTQSSAIKQGATIDKSLQAEIKKLEAKVNNKTTLASGTVGKHKIDIRMEGNFKKVTAGKIDVNLLYEGNPYRISAKSYNIAKRPNIILGSNQPLFQILQRNSADEDFINHYLNILTSHAKGGGKHPLYKDALSIGRFIIAADGIAGAAQKTGYADTLVIADRSSKRIKVISMSSLLNNVDKYFKIIGYDNINWVGYNKWKGKDKSFKSEEAAKTRISDLIVRLHQIKISTTLYGNKLLDTR